MKSVTENPDTGIFVTLVNLVFCIWQCIIHPAYGIALFTAKKSAIKHTLKDWGFLIFWGRTGIHLIFLIL